jgi:hypothetical protein
LRLKAWSEEETGVPTPVAAHESSYRTDGHCAWVEPDGSGAILSFASAAGMSRGDLARPFQRVLIPMLYAQQLGCVHAALVAADAARVAPGLMLVGPSGTGKSTTTLKLLQHGYRIVADDCFALEHDSGGPPMGHSMFGTACLTDDAERRVPGLPGTLVRPANMKKTPKSVLVFPAGTESPMARSIPVRALVFPVVVPSARESRIVPIGVPEAMRRFMPGLRFLVRFDALGRSSLFASLTRIVEDLPSYRLELGPRLDDTPPLMDTLTESLR